MSNLITIEKQTLQRIITLAARVERLSMKVYLGVNLSAEEFDALTDGQREYSELISEFGLHHPPIN